MADLREKQQQEEWFRSFLTQAEFFFGKTSEILWRNRSIQSWMYDTKISMISQTDFDLAGFGNLWNGLKYDTRPLFDAKWFLGST